MPATVTGGKLDPAKNRVRTSDSLQGNAMWQSVIGVSADAQKGNNAAIERIIAAPQTKPSRTNQKQSRQEAAAEAMKMTSNFDTGVTDYESLLSLAKSQGCLANEKRGACKICGQVGHLTKQCRNQFSKFYAGEDGKVGQDAGGGAYALIADGGEHGEDGREKAPREKDGYGSDDSLSSLSSFDDEEERKKRKKAKKEKRRHKEVASFFNFNRRAGTVRSVKAVEVGTRSGTLRKHLETTLGSGTIEQAVQLPRGEDKNEWLAVNTVLFYNAASVLYSVLDGTLCNDDVCPVMNAGPSYEYLWADGVKVKTPIKLSAPRYVNALFDHIEEQIDDPSLFPRGIGGKFPKDFVSVVKNILKRLFRVYAHIYHSHFRSILALGMESHLNMSFRHMILFVKEFDLIDERDMAPMSELVSRLVDTSEDL